MSSAICPLPTRDAGGRPCTKVLTTLHPVGEEQTLALLLPHLRTLGITRLADQTGLDTLGVPVVAAIRPNSRSLAVHQGKGVTRTQAKISAIMEAAECFLAENPVLPLRLAALHELEDAVDPDGLAILRPLARNTRILWAQGIDLLAGAPRWVPFELVHTDFTETQPMGSFYFHATSNGMGAGLTRSHAQRHAIHETIERDAVALWRDDGGPAARNARPIELGSVADPACAAILLRIHGQGVEAVAWHVPSGSGLPVIQALLVPPDGGLAGIEPEMGAACHPDPAQALLRALTEAAQSRVTRIAGARDDYDPASYGPEARAARLAEAWGWRGHAHAGRSIALDSVSGATSSLDAALDGLRRRGVSAAVWVDLAQAGLPFACGRIVAAGLAGPYTPG